MNDFILSVPELRAESELDTALLSLVFAVAIALVLLLIAALARRQYRLLPELRLQADSLSTAQDHCVVIPARDADPVIGRAVRSFPGSLTIVVDDQSNDRTIAHAQEAGAEVRPARPVERGWRRKANACWTGALYTDSAWILFAAPESWYEPRFLPSLLTHAAAQGLHAATVLPRVELLTWPEKMLGPLANGLTYATLSARQVSNPKRPEAFANGECLLFRRSAYNFIGGHKAVANKEMEDLALARLIKRHRMNIAVLRCEAMAHVHRYPSFSQLWRGLEQTLLRCARSGVRSAILLAFTLVAAALWLPVLVALLGHHLYLPAVVFGFVPVLALHSWYGSLPRALWAPIALCLCPWIAVSAALRTFFGDPPS